MSKEFKLGAVALVTLAIMIYGYTFLKGKELFAKRVNLQSVYSDVYQLAVSSPVYINGLKVGNVTKIEVNPTNAKEMMVSYFVEGDFQVPNDAKAVMISEGLVGGKALSLDYDTNCSGANCAKSGDVLVGTSESLLASMVSKEELNGYIEIFTTAFEKAVQGEDGKNPIANSMANLDTTLRNIASITAQIDGLLQRSSRQMQSTLSNVESITANLANNNQHISSMLTNLDQMTTNLNKADIAGVVDKANLALTDTDSAIKTLQATLESGNTSVQKLNDIMSAIKEGEGSLGKLVFQDELYNNLESTSQNLSLLLQDLRLNPKRYVSLSVFGRKNSSPYTYPEDDPAFNQDQELDKK